MPAVYGPKTLLQIYHEAMGEACPFLYINLMQRDKEKMCMESFT